MRTFTREQLMELLDLHRKWVRDEEGGKRANLSDADLSGADLSGADLSDADLSGADLSGANLRRADLRRANLRRADLRRADLRRADLRRADLSGADLSDAKEDFFKILNSAPNEVPGLSIALQEGRVDGSTYTGECCCLVGTIAKIRKCGYEELVGIEPDSSRPAEKWFLNIRSGHTPENNVFAKITMEWIEEWQSNKTVVGD